MSINYNNKKYTDLSYLRSISKGNTVFEGRMLNAFVSQSKTDVDKLKQALLNKDWDAIYLVAHKMKPSLQFVGLYDLQAEITSVEYYAKQKINYDKLFELVSGISAIIELAVNEIKEELVELSKEKKD